MNNTELQFKRANFFTGLMATPQFWNDIQDYHFSKEHFYNKIFHGLGVVTGIMNELKVHALEKSGTLTVIVSPGFALDNFGRGVFLHEPKAILIDSKQYVLPKKVYIVLSYQESLDDFYQHHENVDHSGYKKKIESGNVEIVTQIDEEKGHIELARINLEEDDNGEIKSIINSKDFTNPRSNELDFRFVTYAIPAKKGLSPYLKDFLLKLLELTRNVATITFDALPLMGLREMQTVSLTAKMLVACGNVNFSDIIHVLQPLFDLNNQIIQEILDYERKEEKRYFSAKEEFELMRRSVYEMGDLIKYYDFKYETLDRVLKAHQTVISCLKSMLVTKRITLNDIAMMSYDLPRILLIQDERFTLVDYLDTTDPKNVESHNLDFSESKDISSSNQAYTYPDGALVRDTVRRYVGGKAIFNVKNLIKNRKMLMVRRTDIIRGNYVVDVSIGNMVNKSLLIDGTDTQNRWRNYSVMFQEEEVKDYSLQVGFTIGNQGRDNFGKVWIYQKL